MPYNDNYADGDYQDQRIARRVADPQQTPGINQNGAPPPVPPPAQPPPAQPPQGTYDRNSFRDAWMGSGAKTPQDLANFVQQHQSDFGAGVRIGGNKGDMITLPDGTVIDAVRAAGLGGQGATWTGIPSQTGAGGGAAPGAGAPGAGGAGGGVSSASQDPMIAELLKTLQARAGQSLNINAATDPNIRQQADPYAANLERQRRGYLSQLAEQSGPNANLQNEARLTAEQTGQQAGQYEGGLVGNEIQARRTEIQNALSQMGGMLSDQQKLNLQKELGYLDDATKRYGINTQANTAQSQISNDWQKALLGNDQFYSRLGLDAENSYNDWNKAFSGA